MAGDEVGGKLRDQLGLNPGGGGLLLGLGVTARGSVREYPLGLDPGLVRRHRAVFPDGVLARVSPIAGGSILDEEDLATGWRALEAEALEVLVPPDLVGSSRRGEGIDDALGELAGGHRVRARGWLPGLHIGSQKNATGAMARNEQPTGIVARQRFVTLQAPWSIAIHQRTLDS